MSLISSAYTAGLSSSQTLANAQGSIDVVPSKSYSLTGSTTDLVQSIYTKDAAGSYTVTPYSDALKDVFGQTITLVDFEVVDVEIYLIDGATSSLGLSTTITGVAATDVITTSAAHGLAIGDIVFITAITGGSGITADANSLTPLYVLTVPTSTTLTLSATPGGATKDFTTAITAGTMVGWQGWAIVCTGPTFPTVTHRVFGPTRLSIYQSRRVSTAVSARFTSASTIAITAPALAVSTHKCRVTLKGAAT